MRPSIFAPRCRRAGAKSLDLTNVVEPEGVFVIRRQLSGRAVSLLLKINALKTADLRVHRSSMDKRYSLRRGSRCRCETGCRGSSTNLRGLFRSQPVETGLNVIDCKRCRSGIPVMTFFCSPKRFGHFGTFRANNFPSHKRARRAARIETWPNLPCYSSRLSAA